MRGNPGAISVMTVMVFYPLLIPLCASLYRKEDSDSLYRLIHICAWIVLATDLVYVLAYSTYVGHLLQTVFDHLYSSSAAAAVNYDTYAKKFSLQNIVSIVFILPFFISSLLFPKPGSGRIHIFLIVLLGIFVAVLTGRRAVLVSMIVGPAIAFILTITRSHNLVNAKQTSSWRWLLIVALTISICIYLAFEWTGIEYSTNLINSTFNFTDNESNLERVYQYHSLMRGIYDAPMFGHGAGAVADYIRTIETPWAYELSYVLIIFQYGIIGFLLYALGIVFLCWHLISSIKEKGRSSFEFYFLSGFIAFMIANATNPYLAKFDSMWIVFIPYAIVNRKFILSKNANFVHSCPKQRFLVNPQS
jgi:hypothetical protein